MGNRRGQNILEYVIVLTVIVAAILVGASTFASRTSGTAGLGKLMNKTGAAIENAGTNISGIKP